MHQQKCSNYNHSLSCIYVYTRSPVSQPCPPRVTCLLILNRCPGAPGRAIFKSPAIIYLMGLKDVWTEACAQRARIPDSPSFQSWDLCHGHLLSQENPSALMSPWGMENAELLTLLASVRGAPALCHSVLGNGDRAVNKATEDPYTRGANLLMGQITQNFFKNRNAYSFTSVNSLFLLHQ